MRTALSSGRRRRGFTLVELLVVIAIIAVLVGLLLPAISKVRDAADRSECGNNLHQIGIALYAYHDANKQLPPSAASNNPPYGVGGSWGFSWRVWILPYIEQGPLYTKLQPFMQGGVSAPGWTGSLNGVTCSSVLSGVRIPLYRCPATTLPMKCTSPANGADIFVSNYVALEGAYTGVITNPVWNDSRVWVHNGTGNGGGVQTAGGVLVPNGEVKLTGIPDGNSNTIMITEQSVTLTIGAAAVKAPWNATSYHGWAIGMSGTGAPPASPGDGRPFGATTVYYGINVKHFPGVPVNNAAANGGDCSPSYGICVYSSSLVPPNSTHVGGVNALFADGSVRFISERIPVDTLGKLAVRDDTFTVPNF